MVSLNNNFELDNPSEDVLAWCQNLVRTLADGAVWGIPRSGTVFRIDKKNKKLVRITAGDDDEADFLATQRVFKRIGYDVVDLADGQSES